MSDLPELIPMVGRIHSLANLRGEIRERELLKTFESRVAVSSVPPVVIVEVATDTVPIELHYDAVDPFDIDTGEAVLSIHEPTSADSGCAEASRLSARCLSPSSMICSTQCAQTV